MSKATTPSPADIPADPRRRNFLRGGAIAGAAGLAAPMLTGAAVAEPAEPPRRAPPPAPDVVAESHPPALDPVSQTECGADFMVDVLRSLDIAYMATNPASNVRGLHEAIINHGGNKPELITCNHEDIATAMAHGYAKMAGKPMGVMIHGTVGLQHASMALYNAYCDRVPIYMLVGNIVDAQKRGHSPEWQHSAQDPAQGVRDYLKWDDQPASLQHFAESAVRAWQIATTPPHGPVLLSLDAELQENPPAPGGRHQVRKRPRTTPPVADSGALAEIARLLVAAENPVIVADRMARTQAGMDALVELAELLQCAVIDQGGRTNFPSRHPLNHSVRARAATMQADLILGLELSNYWDTLNQFNDRVHRRWSSIARKDLKTVSIGVQGLLQHANYQEFGRYQEVDLAVTGDGQASLPLLIAAVRSLVTSDRRLAFQARGVKLAESGKIALDAMRVSAAIGWDGRPITTGRMCAELYNQIRNDDWSLVGQAINTPYQRRLWEADRVYRYNGNSGGYGVGYNCPASLGAALANRDNGRLNISIQGDGDLLFAPATLWTAAHHRIPILYVMHNNRAYHQEKMHVQKMTNRMGRGIRNAHIGTAITDPNVDFAALARSFGVFGEGPIEDPKDLGPALARALAVVRRGEPALVDVVSDGR